MDSLNALQRILNNIEGSLASAGPHLTALLAGFLALFSLLALVALCYGLLWNGRVLHGAFGLMIRLALVSWARDQVALVPRWAARPGRGYWLSRHRGPAHHRRVSRPRRLREAGAVIGRGALDGVQGASGDHHPRCGDHLFCGLGGLLCGICRDGL